jgi:hypothetical protein
MTGFDLNLRILNGLISFCRRRGASEFTAHITDGGENGVSTMTISCPTPPIDAEQLELFSQKLNVPRQREVERNYCELSGESISEGRLAFIGVMIDEAEVSYEGGIFRVHVKRGI